MQNVIEKTVSLDDLTILKDVEGTHCSVSLCLNSKDFILTEDLNELNAIIFDNERECKKYVKRNVYKEDGWKWIFVKIKGDCFMIV